MRGESQKAAKPRAKAPASSKSAPRSRRQGKGYAPGKLGAVRRAGLSPLGALVAAGVVVGAAMIVTLATGHRAEKLAASTGSAAGGQLAGLGFRLKTVHVEGASAMATPDILRAAAVFESDPLLSLDLEQIRQRVEAVGWVKEARVVRLLPDTLVLAVVERRQLAVWQHGGRSYVIDETGKVIPEADPGRFARLPLIVGAGANEAAAAILPEVAARPRLAERTEALVRVDGRRWDLRMKDGSLVQLPAVDEGAALIQLEQLDQRSRILELGFERIDLRDPSVVAVRPRDGVLPGQLVANGA